MIYVTGDIHGDRSRLAPSALRALKKGDVLIVAGDFGFIWDDSKSERKYLESLGKRDYEIWFLDGAHENFELLNSYEVIPRLGGRMRQIGMGLYHLPRGEIYTVEGCRIFVMGGGSLAETADFESVGSNIPDREELTEAARRIAASGYETDYIITHEPPGKTKDWLSAGAAPLTSLSVWLDELEKRCKYKKWYFGSVHRDVSVSDRQTAVYRNIIPLAGADK